MDKKLTSVDILPQKLGHLELKNQLLIHKQIKLRLKSYLVVKTACQYLISLRFDSRLKVRGYGWKNVVMIMTVTQLETGAK